MIYSNNSRKSISLLYYPYKHYGTFPVFPLLLFLFIHALTLFCRCWVRNPAGGQSDQAQSGVQRGRPRDGEHEDSEHLQKHRNQVQTQRAIR